MISLKWPLAKNFITQKFGENPSVYKPMGLNGHDGIDLRTKDQSDADGIPGHTFVYAAASGKLETVRNDGKKGYGLHIRIRHTDGSLTIYGHLSSALRQQGDTVNAGDKIGVTGNSGFSSAPHLHFEYRPVNESVNNGYAGAIDPLPFLTMSDLNETFTPEQIDAFKWHTANHFSNITDPTILREPILRIDFITSMYRYHLSLKDQLAKQNITII